MRVLISGFMPFGGRELNPTALLVDALEKGEISVPSGMSVSQILLPVTFQEAFHSLQRKINDFNPDVVLSFGQAAGRGEINLERIAVNKVHADIPDNSGYQPLNQMVNHLGPPSYESTLPLQGLEGALRDATLPVKISDSAGTYVCNHLFYRMMEANQDTLRLCGFIHVPLLPEQASKDQLSLSFVELKRAFSVMLEYLAY